MSGPDRRPDRVAGAVLVLCAVAIALEARTFVVSFVTDPVGPRALPLLVAAVLASSGFVLLTRPGEGGEWPAPSGWLRIGLATGSLLLYALVLETMGFFVSTTGEITVLALLFGGRPLKSSLTAAAFTGFLYVVFVFLLRLSLPIGSVFVRSG